jgi:uncharacterized membrane protein
MKILTHKLNLNLIPKWIPITILLLALIGFGDATYLVIEHFLNKIPPCSIGGCETVLSSSYSKVFGIPISLFGAIYYFAIITMIFAYFDTKKEILLRIPLFVSAIGLLCSIWLISIMAFVIKAFCPYCLVSAISSLIIFAVSCYTLMNYRDNNLVSG